MKKRIISLLLTLVVVLGMVPMGALAAETPLYISLVEKNNFVAGKNAEFDFSVENTGEQATTAYLMTALYAKNGNEMMTCNYFKKEIEPKETLEWGTMLAVPAGGNYQLKVFAWDRMEHPETISNVLIVEMGEDDTPTKPVTYTQALKDANAYVSKITPEIRSIGGEWTVLGLARNDLSQLSEEYVSTYYNKVKQYIEKQNTETRPWSYKVTDVERVILALSSIGKNPADVDGVNLYDYIWNREAHMDDKPLGERQGVNELIFGLLALDALPDVEQPKNATITRKQIIDKIYEYKTTDSGFSLHKNAESLDADITAMTIQALAPYYDTDTTVKSTVDAALTALSDAQQETGEFSSEYIGGESSESLAQVLVALSTLNIDADTDNRFIKNGTSVLDALLAYYDAESGGFKHTLDGQVGLMGTEQVLYALVAYDRFKNDENELYNMEDVEMNTEDSQPEDEQLDAEAVQNQINNNNAYQAASKYAKKITVDAEDFDTDFAKQVAAHKTEYDAMDEARAELVNLIGKTTTQSKLTALLNTMESTVTAFEAAIAEEPDEKPIGTVSLSIEKRMIGKWDTLPLTKVNLYEDDTVWDVFHRACDKRNIDYKYSGTVGGSGTGGIYIQSIDGDGEFDHGSESGWKFSVNNEFPSQGVSAYALKDNDELRVRYCLSTDSAQLNAPLADYVKNTLLPEAEKKLKNSDKEYEESSKTALRTAVEKAKQVVEDHATNSTEDERAVNTVICDILSAYEQLVEIIEDGTPTNFENDLWLKYDFAEMKVGEKQYCQGRRVPEVIAWIPNFNFDIVSGDSVAIEAVENQEEGSGYFGHTIGFNATAVKEGVTIIKVTYDEGTHGKTYEASSPVNTAYVVYSVIDEEDEQIEIKDTIELDSYDTVYFTEDSAKLDFDVTAPGATSITVTCNGEELTANGDTYTATLKNRANIIGMEASDAEGNTRCKYKVVDARKIKVKLQNLSRPDQPIAVNDEVKVSFVGITMPIYKLETIYNPTRYGVKDRNNSNYNNGVMKGTYVEYTYGDDVYEGVAGGQYNLHEDNDFTATFTESGEQTLSGGRIFCSWWGEKLGQDKISNMGGQANLNASVHDRYFSSLPDITVDVKAEVLPTEITLAPAEKTLAYGETYTITPTYIPANAAVRNAEWKSSNPECISVSEDGTVTVRKPNTTAVITHTVDGAEATCTVTASPVTADVVDSYIANIPEKAEQDYSTVPAIEEAQMLFESLADDEKSTVEAENITKLDEAVSQLDTLRKMPPYAFFTKEGERIPFEYTRNGATNSDNPSCSLTVYVPELEILLKRYDVVGVLNPKWKEVVPDGTGNATMKVEDGAKLTMDITHVIPYEYCYDYATFIFSPHWTEDEVAEYVEANKTYQSATKLMEEVTEEQKKLDGFAAFEAALKAVEQAGAIRKPEADVLLTTLKEAYKAYNENFAFIPTITQATVEGGTKVTMTFDKLDVSKLGDYETKSFQLQFKTNINELPVLKGEEVSKKNRQDLKIISFIVPDNFEGTVELTSGFILDIYKNPRYWSDCNDESCEYSKEFLTRKLYKDCFGTIEIALDSTQPSAE